MVLVRYVSALAAYVLVILIVSVCLGIPLRANNGVDVSAVDLLIRRLMSTYNVPGASLAVIQDGRVVLEKGYGYRDLETHAPVTTRTLFNIGSISKSFTALGVAELVDQHKLDFDTPIIRYVADFRLSDPHVTPKVTLRQLLSHTSGLPSDEHWPPQVPPSRQEIMHEFAAMPITAQPGTRFQYCSRCVVLAAYVLERVTEQSWEAYTRMHTFAPLGMTGASFGPVGLEQAPDRAQPYQHEFVFGDVPVPWNRLQYLEPLGPGGGIDASVADMARYALFQVGDGQISGRRVVSTRLMAELHRPEIAVGASWTSVPIQNLHYALGWFTADYRGVHLVYHNGANPGYRASIVLVPSSNAGVVILTNGESSKFTDAVSLDLVGKLL